MQFNGEFTVINPTRIVEMYPRQGGGTVIILEGRLTQVQEPLGQLLKAVRVWP
jgi:hypothetical protein